jgi:agmatinase
VTPIDELRALLRPAGGGLYLVSTGKRAQLELQQRLYGVANEAEVARAFDAALERLAGARAFILGVPSDVGAGFRRGANLGPQALREGLLDAVPELASRSRELGLVDLGDVFVVPQLLHDEMLSEAQKERSRRALYPDLPAHVRAELPVSPLSIAQRATALALSICPGAAPVVLGGDHSTAYPVVTELLRAHQAAGRRTAVVQSDAHTDLLAERLGVQHCFATWSYHVNDQLGRDGRLVQVGVRASGRDREHWEGTLGVRQLWADECRRDEGAAIARVVSHLEALGVDGVYFSNDIDGTDAELASATGTPEPGGLSPELVLALIRALGERFGLVGGDVMELAPPLGADARARATTIDLSVRYLRATLTAILGAAV